MKIKDILKREFDNFSLFEKIFFPLTLILTISISMIMNDSKIALISALCGMSYTFLAGKGRISCYFIGVIGSFCYCFISFKNGFFGNLFLYALYYIPMQILGIFNWQKHFKKNTREIIKTKLSKKEKIIYFSLMIVLSLIFWQILLFNNGKNPIFDSITTTFSIFGQLFTLKRCIDQWYVWIVVNILSFIMWLLAYINGSNCLATVIMWFVYSFLAFYFLYKWKKEV